MILTASSSPVPPSSSSSSAISSPAKAAALRTTDLKRCLPALRLKALSVIGRCEEIQKMFGITLRPAETTNHASSTNDNDHVDYGAVTPPIDGGQQSVQQLAKQSTRNRQLTASETKTTTSKTTKKTKTARAMTAEEGLAMLKTYLEGRKKVEGKNSIDLEGGAAQCLRALQVVRSEFRGLLRLMKKEKPASKRGRKKKATSNSTLKVAKAKKAHGILTISATPSTSAKAGNAKRKIGVSDDTSTEVASPSHSKKKVGRPKKQAS